MVIHTKQKANADKYDINIGREIAEYVIDHMIEEVKKIVSG